jgi:hypothetical protein
MKRALALLTALTFITGSTACARKPEVKVAQRKIQKFFLKYGKEFPETVYGKHPVTDVDVSSQEEIHKNLIATDAYLSLSGGDMQKVSVTLERRFIRWKIISWEKLL